MNVFTILSDLLKLEKLFAIFGVIVFTGVLIIESKYVGSEGSGAAFGSSPLAKPVVLLQYAVEAISFTLMLLRWKTVIRPLFRDPFLWGLAILAIFSFLWSDFSGFTKNRAISTMLTAMFGVYLASRYSLKEQVKIVAWGLGITAVFSLIYTGVFPGAGREQGIHAGAWRGPFIHKNILARLMACTAIPTLLVALDSPPKYRYQLWTVFGITALLIQLSRSKTGLIIFISLMLLVPLFKAMRWKGGVTIPFLTIIVLMGSSTITWLVENWEPFLYGLGKDPTLSGRTYVWDAAIEKIMQRPWLGYGYQAFWKSSGGAEYVWTAVGYPVAQAHNGFINMALDLGIVGLLFFALSLATLYIRGIALLRITKSSAELWPLLYVSFLILYNQTESTIIEHNNIFWILHVSVTLSIGYIRRLYPQEIAQYQEKENLKKSDRKRFSIGSESETASQPIESDIKNQDKKKNESLRSESETASQTIENVIKN